MAKVKAYRQIGEQQTYDLEVAHKDHQFYLANGVLTSNSHAVSYSINSYYCAWLMTHYEEEWLCAYLEASSDNPTKRTKALSEIKKLGYTVVPIDINSATKSWTILPGKKFMPSFLSLKGLGAAAVDEIVENRPYSSLKTMLWNADGTWRHSKFNKRAISSLIKMGAFESLDIVGEDKLFESYTQMHEVIIENNAAIKKRTKKQPMAGIENFKQLVKSTRGMPAWTRLEKVKHSTDILGSFNTAMLVSNTVQEKLAAQGISVIDEFHEKDLYWFVITDIIEKLTKNKKKYLLLTVTGLGGATNRMFCWGYNGKVDIPKFSLCVAEVDKSDFGFATTQWKLKVLN